MTPKKAVVVVKKPMTKKVKIILKQQPKVKKQRKPSSKEQELIAQGLKHYSFVQNIEMFQKWADFWISKGVKPNDRLKSMILADLRMIDEEERLKKYGIYSM